VITEDTEDKICAFYIDFLIQAALRHGIEPKKIITHSFYGLKAKNGGGQSGAASISSVEGVIPGWSWYDADFSNIDKAIAKANGGSWAAIEVKQYGLTEKDLIDLFNYKNNRYINIFNWEGAKTERETLKILNKLLSE